MPDIDYGVNATDPESIIAVILDNAQTALLIMNELASLGFAIVPKDLSVASAVETERDRCFAIVEAARFGEVDRDFRAICHMIEGGRSLEQIKG